MNTALPTFPPTPLPLPARGPAASTPEATDALLLASQRILQRTAQLLWRTPGGLRFVPGSRPWLPAGGTGRASSLLVTESPA